MLHQPPTSTSHTQRNAILIIVTLIMGTLALAIVGVAVAGDKPAPARTTIGPLPFDGMASVLASHCDSAQAIKTSILVLVSDGDKDCATATLAALNSIGFSKTDYAGAMLGKSVKRGRNTLSIQQATDGAIVAVQQD